MPAAAKRPEDRAAIRLRHTGAAILDLENRLAIVRPGAKPNVVVRGPVGILASIFNQVAENLANQIAVRRDRCRSARLGFDNQLFSGRPAMIEPSGSCLLQKLRNGN